MATWASGVGYGTVAGTPAPAAEGKLYFTSDTRKLYRDSGAAWVEMVLDGSGRHARATADMSVPPGSAQLTASFGTPSALGNGYMGVVDVGAAGTACYLAMVSGDRWITMRGTVAS